MMAFMELDESGGHGYSRFRESRYLKNGRQRYWFDQVSYLSISENTDKTQFTEEIIVGRAGYLNV